MTKRFGVALLALPLLAVGARADDPFAPSLPFRVECGANAYFRVLSRENGWGCCLGPWYNYWPMEAHFQTPALPCYPFWPLPQGVVPGGLNTYVPPPYCPPGAPAVPPAVPTPAPAAEAAPKAPPSTPTLFRPVVNPYAPGYPQSLPYGYGR